MLTVCVFSEKQTITGALRPERKATWRKKERETSALLVLPSDLLLQQLKVKQWCQEDGAGHFKPCIQLPQQLVFKLNDAESFPFLSSKKNMRE